HDVFTSATIAHSVCSYDSGCAVSTDAMIARPSQGIRIRPASMDCGATDALIRRAHVERSHASPIFGLLHEGAIFHNPIGSRPNGIFSSEDRNTIDERGIVPVDDLLANALDVCPYAELLEESGAHTQCAGAIVQNDPLLREELATPRQASCDGEVFA